MKHLGTISIMALLAVLPACTSYQFAGRPFNNINTVGVKVFTNKTLYRDIDFLLTNQLNKEIVGLTRYTIAQPSKADAYIEGEITDYQELPEAIDENEEVTARKLVATVKFKLVDGRNGNLLAEPQTAKWTEVYRVRTDKSLAEVRERTFRTLAQKIVEQVFIPWPDTGGPPSEIQQE